MWKEFLFFVNAGDEEWKMINEGGYHYDDIAFHKGKLYAVTRSEEHAEVMVAAYDLITMDSTPHDVSSADIIWVLHAQRYINIRDFWKVKKAEYYINIVEVLKVDTGEGVIIKMNNLGKYTLLLSAASSLCIDTSSLPDLRSNYIYVSNDLCEIGYRDNLVYNMEDESFTSLSLPSLSSPRRRRSVLSSTKLQRPVLVWFAPSIALHVDPM
ncbi:uncharacterized protein LOC121986698 [Zingiber officinale]|uniref:uncharacterized protein LOC121986698 n=1 Tax=Zingiber officinale TaxID=94328 RepID=UPI001C4BC9BE|nr:uncharacterized protein LOC121986698 [Zingiber officinale]